MEGTTPEFYELTVGSLVIDPLFRGYEWWPIDYSQMFIPSMGREWTFSELQGEDDDPPTKGMLFRAPLRIVSKRLELLGVTKESIQRIENHMEDLNQSRSGSRVQPNTPPKPRLDLIRRAILEYRIPPLKLGEAPKSRREFAEELAELASSLDILPAKVSGVDSIERWFAHAVADTDSLVLLHLLSLQPENHLCEVRWSLVSDGYFDIADDTSIDLAFGARPEDRFMLVTEGKSDTRILERAIQLYRNDFADFFTFVDMEHNYSFTGVGNLLNFYKGLVKLGVLNQIIVIFDNDLVGSDKWQQTEEIPSIENIRAIKLPDLKVLENFDTHGPEGMQSSNINGRASSIECFLDLSWGATDSPAVRWKSYNDKLENY